MGYGPSKQKILSRLKRPLNGRSISSFFSTFDQDASSAARCQSAPTEMRNTNSVFQQHKARFLEWPLSADVWREQRFDPEGGRPGHGQGGQLPI